MGMSEPVFVQRRVVVRQHAEMVRQHRAMVTILQRQIELAGKDPLAEEEVQRQQAEVVATVASPEQRPGEGLGADSKPLCLFKGLDPSLHKMPTSAQLFTDCLRECRACQEAWHSAVVHSVCLAGAEWLRCTQQTRFPCSGHRQLRGRSGACRSSCAGSPSFHQQAREADAGSRGEAAYPLWAAGHPHARGGASPGCPGEALALTPHTLQQ